MMLFPAVLMNFLNSKVCLIGEWSITVYFSLLVDLHSIIQMLSYSKNLGLDAKHHQSLVSDFWIRDSKVMLYLIVK